MKVGLYQSTTSLSWWFVLSDGSRSEAAISKDDLLEDLFYLRRHERIDAGEFGRYLNYILKNEDMPNKDYGSIKSDDLQYIPFEILILSVRAQWIGIGNLPPKQKFGRPSYYVYIFSPFFIYGELFTTKEEGYDRVENLAQIDMIDDEGYSHLYSLVSDLPMLESYDDLMRLLSNN